MVKTARDWGLGIGFLIAMIVAVALQQSRSLIFLGAKINLPLIVLAVGLVLFRARPVWYFGLLFLASVGLAFYPGLDRISLAVALAGLLGYWIYQRFLTGGFVAVGVLAILLPSVVYAVVDYRFFLDKPGLLVLEIVYNGVATLLVFALVRFFFELEE